MTDLLQFLKESNLIEGITAPPSFEEQMVAATFLDLSELTLNDFLLFVGVNQGDAVLRDRAGLNVQIGGGLAPLGDITIKTRLLDLIADANENADPYQTHVKYEMLHPFTDCNGRSGRILWLWMMRRQKRSIAHMGFLQTFYYQTLASKHNDSNHTGRG